MESIIVACIIGVVTFTRVILSISKSRAVMEVKLEVLAVKVEKQNQVLEHQQARIEVLLGRREL